MAELRKLEIEGYRSIKSASIELRHLNVLIGANGAGKSNFVSFFKLLNEMMGKRLQEYIGTSGRAQSLLYFGSKTTYRIAAKLEFQSETGLDWYSMRLVSAPRDALIFAEETLRFQNKRDITHREVTLGAGHQETRIADMAAENDPTARTFRYFLNQCRVYHFHDTSPTARIRQSCYINDNRWLMPDASNLAAMLYLYREQKKIAYKRIISTIRKIAPEFDDFTLEPDRLNPKDIFLNWRMRGSEYLFGPHQISDGMLRAMAIVTLLLQPESDLPDVIILDEPELGLHPYALEIIAGLVQSVSTKSQVIVATQSESFLNYFQTEDIITVEWNRGQTQFRRLEAEPLKDWLEDYSIGELWQRNVLGGGPLP
jgi:predicted ATPase